MRHYKINWLSWKTLVMLWTSSVTNIARNNVVSRKSWNDFDRFRWLRNWKFYDRRNRLLILTDSLTHDISAFVFVWFHLSWWKLELSTSLISALTACSIPPTSLTECREHLTRKFFSRFCGRSEIVLTLLIPFSPRCCTSLTFRSSFEIQCIPNGTKKYELFVSYALSNYQTN